MSEGLPSVHPQAPPAVSGSASSRGADTEGQFASPDSGLAESRAIARGLGAAPPLPRWPNARAELPALRAQLRRSERKRDIERERLIAASLARALFKRRSELDIAVRLARRAVLLGDDSLRIELAGWHCQLGQTSLAVGMLMPLLESPGVDRARLSLRIALYWARLGQAENALAALREAAAFDPDDPLSHELQATVHGWAPRAMSAAQAAEAYLQGAARRARRRDEAAAFQDTLRAFDTAPAHPEAAEGLARALTERSQPAIADEVWRRHAEALLKAGRLDDGLSVQRRRMRALLDSGALNEAFAAALDARLDAAVDARVLLSTFEQARLVPTSSEPQSDEEVFDWLLTKLGLSEVLAARLELAADAASGSLRSRCLLELGNFAEQTLGSTERALEPWIDAIVSDPASHAARANLRRYAAVTGDYMPLVEALIRVGVAEPTSSPEGAGACLRELLGLSEARLADAGLGRWCVERALRLEPRSDELLEAQRSLSGPAAEAERALDEALGRLEALGGDERVSVLRIVAAGLRGRPDRAEQYSAVLFELSARRPDELRWRRLLETLLWRLRDTDGLSRLWTQDLVSGTDPNLALRALVGLARLEREAGNLQGSLAVLATDDGRGLAPAAAMQLALAAQLGQRRLRAEGLLKVAAGLGSTLKALLACVASAELLELGELPAALRAAEVGTHADPAATRPVVAYADAAEGRRDRVAAVAYERAMALTFPSSAHCRGLVAALDAMGEVYAAQVWVGRWLALCPAETAAATQLLRGSAKAGDAARLGDVVAWTVSQAHPLSGWAEPLANALTCLAESDRARAADVAWRVLDALGPEPPALKHAVLVVAEQSGDAELTVAVMERELAADASSSSDASLMRLAQLHFERGEVDRSCAVLVRALAAGLPPAPVLSMLDAMPEAHSPEGEFHRLQARAQAYELAGDTSDACWRALREYGAALWDLARDQTQAVEVWLRAAELGGSQGWFHFARDLVEVLGLERAIDEVCRLAESRDAPEQVAALLTGAAVVSQSRGGRRRALQLAMLALDTDPANVWALEIVESSALAADMPAVESAYRAALGATLGTYGERALHYRAARFFERAGDQQLALAHAISAFRAVPSEGVTFALMLRLAQGLSEAERASRAIEEVAQSHKNGRLRSQWLKRAALIAGRTTEGAQQRTEVLLRALLACPDTEIVDLLGRAFTDLARQQPDGRALGALRYTRAVSKLVPRLSSVEGARVALAMASVALSCFSDARLALEALSGAVALEPELDEFGEFVPEAARLAGEADAALAWLAGTDAETQQGDRGSLPLLELAAELAAALGRMGTAASYLCRRVERGPDSEALLSKAEQAVQKSRDLTLPSHVHRLFPALARQAECLGRAEQAVADQDRSAELAALRDAFELDESLPQELLSRLFELSGEAGEVALAERVLAGLARSDVDPESVGQATQTLAALLIEQRRPQQALKLLRDASERAPDDVGLLTQALSAARAAGDDDQRQQILSRLIELTSDAAKKSLWLNEAWEVAKKRGVPDQALDILRQWLETDPEDPQALSRLEAEHEARQEWAELVDLLARHLALGVSFRERRRLVLWRSEILETKLQRLAEARQELSALVEQAPADRAVVERLARVTEAMGDPTNAAAAWLTASGLSSTRPAAAELAERACRLFLDSGEVMSARRVLAAPQTLPRTLGLARLGVRLEREGENEPRLARALEELGAVEEQPVTDRASALLEAATLWRRLGDEDRACQCAIDAARWAPDDVETQVLASYLEYRRRGPKAPEETQATIDRLRAVLEHLGADQLDLAGFLLAEALDAVEGGDAGLTELWRLRARLGPAPLVSVGLAERLARSASPAAALEHFDAALKGGDLRGLRKPSGLALEAALAARRAELFGLVHRYAKQAETDPELADAVARLREELPSPSSPSVPPGAPKSSPESAPVPLLRAFATSAGSAELEPQTRPARRTQLGLGKGQPRPVGTTQPGGNLIAPGVAPPPPPPPPPAAPRSREPMRPVQAVARAPKPLDELPRPHLFVPKSPAERASLEELSKGSRTAGVTLCERLLEEDERVEDAVAVALLLTAAEPGEGGALSLLERATRASGDVVHHAAVAHVMRCADPSPGEPPPPLGSQLERVDVLRQLLFTEPDGLWPQALEVIWESTRRVLEWETVRDIKAAQRVRMEQRSPLASSYAAAARLLGLSGTPLLQLPGPGECTVSVIVLGEPSVLVRGEPGGDGAQLRYDLGAALAGTLPPYAIINAATYDQIGDLFRAVHSAFGPTGVSQTNFNATARLAALLWESVPRRTQRLMTEWCKDGKLTRELAVTSARRAARRAGLFASGDLVEALARVVAEEGIDQSLLSGSDGLARLCAKSLAAADLVRLAVDPLYAHLRWRPEVVRPGAGLTRRGL